MIPTENIDKTIIVVTGSNFYDRVLQCYKDKAKIFLAQEIDELYQILSEKIGTTLFLDLSLFNDDFDHPTVKTIFKKAIDQRIIVVTNEQEPAELSKLLNQGARGFCQSTISDELLMKAIRVVNEGNLWIGRKTIDYLMNTQVIGKARNIDEDMDQKLSTTSLTPRESEIASFVAKGKCNKTIARDLDISLSTVKMHMCHIFEKLQITDRVQLIFLCHDIKFY